MCMISVIVPVYNVKDRLEKCINSLINQTYQDYEIIIVDDGSTDGSEKLCDNIAADNKQIKVIHKSNGGLSDARNAGIKVAKGQYYLFIDSDDIVNIHFIETLFTAAKEYSADIVETEIMEFCHDDEIADVCKKQCEYNEQEYQHDQLLSEYLRPEEYLKRKIYHGICIKMYKRHLFDGLLFDVGRLHEDLFMTYKLLDRCRKFVYISAPYYYYYKSNANSICNNYRSKNFIDEYDALLLMQKYFADRRSIQSDLIAFCAEHYRNMCFRIIENESKSVKRRKRKIKVWATKNIWKTKSISKNKILKLYLAIMFTPIYRLLSNR